MTVRTVCNQTVRSTKRQVEVQAFEVGNAMTYAAIGGENHINLISYDDTGGVAWFYPGYEHRACGTAQSGTAS